MGDTDKAYEYSTAPYPNHQRFIDRTGRFIGTDTVDAVPQS